MPPGRPPVTAEPPAAGLLAAGPPPLAEPYIAGPTSGGPGLL